MTADLGFNPSGSGGQITGNGRGFGASQGWTAGSLPTERPWEAAVTGPLMQFDFAPRTFTGGPVANEMSALGGVAKVLHTGSEEEEAMVLIAIAAKTWECAPCDAEWVVGQPMFTVAGGVRERPSDMPRQPDPARHPLATISLPQLNVALGMLNEKNREACSRSATAARYQTGGSSAAVASGLCDDALVFLEGVNAPKAGWSRSARSLGSGVLYRGILKAVERGGGKGIVSHNRGSVMLTIAVAGRCTMPDFWGLDSMMLARHDVYVGFIAKRDSIVSKAPSLGPIRIRPWKGIRSFYPTEAELRHLDAQGHICSGHFYYVGKVVCCNFISNHTDAVRSTNDSQRNIMLGLDAPGRNDQIECSRAAQAVGETLRTLDIHLGPQPWMRPFLA